MTEENLVWAEFGDALRLPISDTDYVRDIPWDEAAFMPQLPLIDIGSGSGLVTVTLGEKYPDAEILSVEPDPMMRSLLMSRIAENPELRSRTTVLHDTIGQTWLPERCGGALLFNVIYFLGGRARDRFWQRMADVLAPGAPILMSRSYGGVPAQAVERKLASSATMGRHEYQRWFEAKPGRDNRMEITQTFVVLRDGEKVREEATTLAAWGLDEDLVLEEIPIGKFGIEEINERYFAIRRLPDIKR